MCRAQRRLTERGEKVARYLNKPKLAEWSSLVIVVSLTLVTVTWLADLVQQKASYFFDGDEGLHAYEALRVSAFLHDGDLAGASTASVMDWFYPPVHPWLLGAALTLYPVTHVSVRLFSLAIYALDVLLLYALGRWLARETRWPWLAGLAAALMALMAPPVWVMGSIVYIELLGVLFMLVAFWGYWQGVKGREWGWLVAGLGVVAIWLTKYPYWVFLIVSLALAIHSRTDWRALIKRLIWLMLPSAVVILVWVLWPMTRSGLFGRIAETAQMAESTWRTLLTCLAFYLSLFSTGRL